MNPSRNSSNKLNHTFTNNFKHQLTFSANKKPKEPKVVNRSFDNSVPDNTLYYEKVSSPADNERTNKSGRNTTMGMHTIDYNQNNMLLQNYNPMNMSVDYHSVQHFPHFIGHNNSMFHSPEPVISYPPALGYFYQQPGFMSKPVTPVRKSITGMKVPKLTKLVKRLKKKPIPKSKIIIKQHNIFNKQKNYQNRIKQFEKSWQIRQNQRRMRVDTVRMTPNYTKKGSSISTEKFTKSPKNRQKDCACQTSDSVAENNMFSRAPILSPVRPVNLDNQFVQASHQRTHSLNVPQNMQNSFLPQIMPVTYSSQLCPGWNGFYQMQRMNPPVVNCMHNGYDMQNYPNQQWFPTSQNQR